MAATAVLAFVVICSIAVAFGLVLVSLVRQEGPRERNLDWASAERVARRDPDGDDREW